MSRKTDFLGKARQGLAAYQAIQTALAPIGSLFEPDCVITKIIAKWLTSRR
jgi:hypothetical protein